MCVVSVTASAEQKSQNEDIWIINLNNFKTPIIRVINSVRKLEILKESKIKKLKNSDFRVSRFWPGSGSYIYCFKHTISPSC